MRKSLVGMVALGGFGLLGGPAPAEEAPATHLRDLNLGPVRLDPELTLEAAYFAQSGSWFGRSRGNLGEHSGDYAEGAVTAGFEAAAPLGGRRGELYGGLAAIGALTAFGTDAAGTNVPDETVTDVALGRYFVGWRSGDLLAADGGAAAPDAGEDEERPTIDISVGKQEYEAGSGFLFQGGGTDGGDRAAYWVGPRSAYERTAIARLAAGDLGLALAYLSPDDDPDTNTELWTTDATYSLGTLGAVGGGYTRIFDSDLESRDGLDVYDVRAELTPLAPLGVLPGLVLKGELAFEENDNVEAHGYYGEVGYLFREGQPWETYLSYRYAFFSGDDPDSRDDETFDPLFYGTRDENYWGDWDQGEILGEYVVANSNLKSHMVRLATAPTEKLGVSLLYYYFLLDEPGSFGVGDDKLAHEIDLIVDYELNENVAFSVVGAAARPEDGGEELTGGDDTWYYAMLYTRLTF